MESGNHNLQFAAGHFHAADYAVFTVILIFPVFVGIYFACSGNKQRTVQEYLLGDRNMGSLPVSMSLLASFLSAVGMIAIPSEVYMYGIGGFYTIIGMTMAIPLSAYLYMPIFFKLKLTSVYEYIEKRFDSRIRKIGSLMCIFQMSFYISLVIYAPALALSQVTKINLWGSVAAIGLFGTVYTSVGGIKAVMWTDVFQITIMLLSILVSIFKGAADIGGFSYVFEKNVEGQRIYWVNTSFDPRIRYTLWNSAIGMMSTWLSIYGTNQAQVQRYLSSPSMKAVRTTLWWNVIGLTLFQSLFILSGLIIYAKYWSCDPMSAKLINAPDQIFPLFIMESLNVIPGLPGLFVAGVFSGSLSTVSSILNSLAAVTLEDFVKSFKRWENLSSKRAAFISKIIAMSYGVACLLLVAVVSRLGSIVQVNDYTSRLFGGVSLGLFTLGIFIPWANKYGAYVGVIGSLSFSLWVSINSQLTKQFTSKAPVSTDQCIAMYGKDILIYSNFTENITSDFDLTIQPTMESEYIFPLYQISFRWINFIAGFSVVFIGSIVSLLSGPTKLRNLDIRLLSPPIQYILKKFWKKRSDKIQNQHEEHIEPNSNIIANSIEKLY